MGNFQAIVFGLTIIVALEIICECIENIMESKYNAKKEREED